MEQLFLKQYQIFHLHIAFTDNHPKWVKFKDFLDASLVVLFVLVLLAVIMQDFLDQLNYTTCSS